MRVIVALILSDIYKYGFYRARVLLRCDGFLNCGENRLMILPPMIQLAR